MTEPRWLDDEEQQTWRSFLTASRLLWDRIERQLQQCAGLPHAYYEILVRLSEAPDQTLRMSELASTAMASRSRLSHAVARMEEAGWVRRLPFPGDRRGALAQLTEAGLARLAEAAPSHVEEVRSALFDPLTVEQLAALREISDRLIANLAGEPPWPARSDDPAGAPDPPRAPSERSADPTGMDEGAVGFSRR